MTDEAQKIVEFVKETKLSDSILDMENSLTYAIGYGQRIGELLNEAEYIYVVKKKEFLSQLNNMEDETEITRRAKLDGWLAQYKKDYQDLKNLFQHIKVLRMGLMQGIKTRREEPH